MSRILYVVVFSALLVAAPMAASGARDADVPPPLDLPSDDGSSSKMEELGEMSDGSPGAADVQRGECTLDNCAIVLGIGSHQIAQSIAQDDGSPGLYMPQGMYSAETAGEPGVWDAYGVQKIIRIWDITVLPRNGAVLTIEQRNEPLFRVGDSVLVNGDTIAPWN